jgi:hypothetical protein
MSRTTDHINADDILPPRLSVHSRYQRPTTKRAPCDDLGVFSIADGPTAPHGRLWRVWHSHGPFRACGLSMLVFSLMRLELMPLLVQSESREMASGAAQCATP